MPTPEQILCACGCGDFLAARDGRGRPRKFLHGHNARKAWLSPQDYRAKRNGYYSAWRKRNKDRFNAWQRAYRLKRGGDTHVPISEIYPYCVPHELITIVNEAVPADVSEQIRPDVCQEMIADILDNRLEPSSARRMAWIYVKRAWDQRSSTKLVSLHTPYGENGRTLLDIIPDTKLTSQDDDERCWICNHHTVLLGCKVICRQCGFTRDCSDP